MADRHDLAGRWVLLLGASQDQLFAIKTARDMGLRVLVVDQNPDSPGFALADAHALVSTRDVAALVSLCDAYRARGRRMEGVLVMGSDIPGVVAEVSLQLGSPGVSLETARLASHKLLMKERLAAVGVPVPWFTEVRDAAQLRGLLGRRGPRMVIKPVDRSGARGVFVVTPQSDLEGLFRMSRSLSFGGQVMAEDFLEGPQISTESIMWRGRAYTVGYADRNYEMLGRFAPHIIENGGEVPGLLSPAQRQAVNDLVEHAALALGIENGVAKGDVVLTAEGPKLIEMAARLSGGDFSESLIPLGCGVNIVAEALKIAMGGEPDLEALRPRLARWVANRYFFPPPGVLRAVRGVETLADLPWLHKFALWRKVGDTLPAITCHGDRAGVFLVSADSREALLERVRQIYETVHLDVAPS
ncbi:MAG: ATP-grasp domain-containing protein [Desulfovibrionaceae bacterium]|nr:ATP-grasp domain-containing protein [Desulfovibrionaceae bacterium]